MGRARTDDKLLERVFGQMLRELRRGRGLSQEKLAERSGCSRNHVSLMERGRWGASLHTLFLLAKGLEMRPAELVDQLAERFGEAETRDEGREGCPR